MNQKYKICRHTSITESVRIQIFEKQLSFCQHINTRENRGTVHREISIMGLTQVTRTGLDKKNWIRSNNQLRMPDPSAEVPHVKLGCRCLKMNVDPKGKT